MTTIKHLSGMLSEAREKADVSVTELANRSGVARAALYRFINGEDVRLSTLLAATDSLGLDIVLVPNAISGSLQSAGPRLPNVALQERTIKGSGPRSAVSARMAKLKSKIGNRGRS